MNLFTIPSNSYVSKIVALIARHVPNAPSSRGPPSVMHSNFYYFDLQGASEASSAPLTAWVFGMALRLGTPPCCGFALVLLHCSSGLDSLVAIVAVKKWHAAEVAGLLQPRHTTCVLRDAPRIVFELTWFW